MIWGVFDLTIALRAILHQGTFGSTGGVRANNEPPALRSIKGAFGPLDNPPTNVPLDRQGRRSPLGRTFQEPGPQERASRASERFAFNYVPPPPRQGVLRPGRQMSEVGYDGAYGHTSMGESTLPSRMVALWLLHKEYNHAAFDVPA